MIIDNSLTEIGDVIKIKSQAVVIGNIQLQGYTDNVSGVTLTRYFDKKFRYSLDGVTYSEWQVLNNSNIQLIQGIVKGLLFFEFRYERIGSDSSGILVFNNLQIQGNITLQICDMSSTMESIFAELANNDFYTQSVKNNLLRKIYHSGILPKFIERGDLTDDKDFISFWGAVCVFIAYSSAFAENFENLLFKKEYLSEYLKQQNLGFCDKEIIYDHLYFLATNFYDEIRKRGTSMTYKKAGTVLLDGSETFVDGEWLRILCMNHYDEFLLEVIPKTQSGYCMGKSFPLYNGTYFSTQLNKTEENTKDFVDLSKYRTFGSVDIGGISSQDDVFSTLKIDGNGGLGYDISTGVIPSREPINELISIDDEIDYEVTFNFLRKNGTGNLTVGILCFNRNGVLINNTLQNIKTYQPQNSFLNNQDITSISKITNEWYSFRGIIFSKGTANLTDYQTNLNVGQNLRISNLLGNDKVEKIKICLFVGDADNLELHIHDFKMRPLIRGKNINKRNKIIPSKGIPGRSTVVEIAPYIKNPQFIQSNIFCLNWRKNNNQDKSDNQINNFIQNYLLPYQQKLITIPLTPYVDDKQV